MSNFANKRRAARASAALRGTPTYGRACAYYDHSKRKLSWSCPEDGISDLLCDLRHLCDLLEFDFAELDTRAYRNYSEESDPPTTYVKDKTIRIVGFGSKDNQCGWIRIDVLRSLVSSDEKKVNSIFCLDEVDDSDKEYGDDNRCIYCVLDLEHTQKLHKTTCEQAPLTFA